MSTTATQALSLAEFSTLGFETSYISGPMTGIAGGNAAAFDDCAVIVRDRVPGLVVVSPAEMDRTRGFDIDGWDGVPTEETDLTIDQVLAQDIVVVCQVDCVIALPGWEKSGGATFEIAVAARLGKPVYEWDVGTATLEPLALSSIIAVCQESGYTGSKIHGRLA